MHYPNHSNTKNPNPKSAKGIEDYEYSKTQLPKVHIKVEPIFVVAWIHLTWSIDTVCPQVQGIFTTLFL